MYKDAEQQQREQQTKKDESIKLGRVTAITSQGMPKVTINGSSSESVKTYPCLNSYQPKVGDTVLMQKQGMTYVILGAVETETLGGASEDGDGVEDKWALKDHKHDDLYAPKEHTHSKLKGTNSSAEISFATFTSQQSFAGANGATSTTTNYYSGSLNPDTSDKYALGRPSYKWKAAWISHVIGNYLGNYSSKFSTAHITTVYGTLTNQSSDRRIKTDIVDLGSKFKALFNKLRPVSFRFTDGSSDKTHTGFIAQEVEEAIDEVGLNDLGIVAKDEGGNYYLNYTEFIAIQTQMIQELQGKVEKLEKKIADMENDNK